MKQRGLRLLGHPLHPALTDFPIALWSVAFLWDVVGFVRSDPIWWRFGFWTSAAGLIFALPTLASGLLDYLAISENRIAAERTATRHMIAMLCVTGLFTGSLIVRVGPDPLNLPQEIGVIVLEAIGVVIVLVGAWLGGELVFRHGIGRAGDVNSSKP